jgi:hypothetical protein
MMGYISDGIEIAMSGGNSIAATHAPKERGVSPIVELGCSVYRLGWHVSGMPGGQ